MDFGGSGINSLNDTIIRQVQYAIDVQGQGAITDLQAALGHVNAELQNAATAYRTGIIPIQQYQEITSGLVARQTQLAAQIELASKAMQNGGVVTDGLVQSMRRADQASRGMGNGFIQLSYAMDDLQYGLGALQNNIVPIITAFGGTGPLATGIAIVSAGAMLAYNAFKNFDSVAKAVNDTIRSGITVYETHSERLKQLGAITKKTSEEQAEFNKLKREEQEIEEMRAGKADAAKKTEEATQRAFGEGGRTGGGASEVIGALMGVMGQSGIGRDQTAEEGIAKAREELQNRIANQAVDSLIDESRKALNTLVRLDDERRTKFLADAAEHLMHQAKKDDAARGALIGYARANPGAFAPDFAGSLERSSPEFLKSQAEAKRAYEATLRKADADKKADRESVVGPERDRVGPGRPEEAKILQDEAAKVVRKFGGKDGMEDAVDRRVAELVKEGRTDAEIRPLIRAMILGRLRANGVGEDIAGVASEKMAEAGTTRFDAANAGRVGPGGRDATADEILKDLDKQKTAAAKAEEAKRKAEEGREKARVAELAREHSKADPGVQEAIAQAGIDRNMLGLMDPADRAALMQSVALEARQAAQEKLDQARAMRPRNEMERNQQAAMRDQAELLRARSNNPFPTEEQEAGNQREMLMRQMARSHPMVADDDGNMRPATQEELRRAAGMVVGESQQNLAARRALGGQGGVGNDPRRRGAGLRSVGVGPGSADAPAIGATVGETLGEVGQAMQVMQGTQQTLNAALRQQATDFRRLRQTQNELLRQTMDLRFSGLDTGGTL